MLPDSSPKQHGEAMPSIEPVHGLHLALDIMNALPASTVPNQVDYKLRTSPLREKLALLKLQAPDDEHCRLGLKNVRDHLQTHFYLGKLV